MFFWGFLAKVPPYLRVHCVLEENTVNKVPPDARPGEQEIIPAEKEARFVPPLAAAEVMVVWWYGQAAPSQPLCVLQLVGPALHQRHLLPHEVQPVRQQQVIHPNPSSPLYALNGIVFTDFQTFFCSTYEVLLSPVIPRKWQDSALSVVSAGVGLASLASLYTLAQLPTTSSFLTLLKTNIQGIFQA